MATLTHSHYLIGAHPRDLTEDASKQVRLIDEAIDAGFEVDLEYDEGSNLLWVRGDLVGLEALQRWANTEGICTDLEED